MEYSIGNTRLDLMDIFETTALLIVYLASYIRLYVDNTRNKTPSHKPVIVYKTLPIIEGVVK